MQSANIHHIEILFLLLLIAAAALTAISQRLKTPYPIVLVVGGLALSLIPHVPRVSLSPKLIFLVVLPPLLYSAAYQTSWREFQRNSAKIAMLAFGLVGFTVFGVAAFTTWLIPGFTWALGLVLGAVVCTTDSIAATSIARRIGLPRQITELLEAESLANDASGLLALKFAVALVVTGVAPSLIEGFGQLVYQMTVGTAVGVAVAALVRWVQNRTEDPRIEITISLMTPYLAYLAAENIQSSGFFATVACGLFMGRRTSGHLSLPARIQADAVWSTLDFLLNALVFTLVGLQLPYVLGGIRHLGLGTMIFDGVIFSAAVIVLRLMWIMPEAWLSYQVRRVLFHRNDEPPNLRSAFLVGWTGLRGVLALAAAISLPEQLANGNDFPLRNNIIFLTFCLILATLVLQGLSLPPLIRTLGLAGSTHNSEELEARRRMVKAALDALCAQAAESGTDPDGFAFLRLYYQRRLALLDSRSKDDSVGSDANSAREDWDLARRLRAVERQTALDLSSRGEIHDEVLRDLERELDLLDARWRDPTP
ncbi:MAG: Na+/H+ antiporter [Bryobacteraceae bacterium]